MKKTAMNALITAAALLWVVPAGATGADNVVRSFRQQIPVGGADQVYLEFPVGEVTVAAWDNPQVNLDVKVACNQEKSKARCTEAAQGLRLVYNTSGDRLHVEVKNWPKLAGGKGLHLIARINVPRDLPLRTELGVGELSVQGTTSDSRWTWAWARSTSPCPRIRSGPWTSTPAWARPASSPAAGATRAPGWSPAS
jgi:hypothetical protein